MVKVFLNIGSNINRQENICAGLDDLHRLYGALSLSSIYESEPVGFKGDCFYNMAVMIETDSSLAEVNQSLKSIEDVHGRRRGGEHFAPRTLDIDVVSYDQYLGAYDGIELPRAELYYNAFVLWPMAELAPALIDVKTGLSFASLWLENQREILSRQSINKVASAWLQAQNYSG
jgi:2-amino-4-hydroxy-6-hydroxymethyldihydropteridine diphosphokinase